MSQPDQAWLLDAVADPANGWSVGTFGAIAEFTRDPGEPVDCVREGGRASAATARGAIRLEPMVDLLPVAYETPNRDGESWSHAVALCMPAGGAAMTRRTVLTEIGPDDGAVRAEDRGAVLFDMGLGTLPVDVCIRTADPELLARLREGAGHSLFAPGNGAMGAIVAAGPHRVFISRAGRAEVFQPIPPPDGQSPEGPHTHVLPKLLRSGRTHAATTPLPDGLVPCAHLFPPHPARDPLGRRKAFDAADHARFEEIAVRFGRRDLMELKFGAAAELRNGAAPESFAVPDDKHARAQMKVLLRQLRTAGDRSPKLERWISVFDRARDEEPDEDEQPVHS